MTCDDQYQSALRAKLIGAGGAGGHMPLTKDKLEEYSITFYKTPQGYNNKELRIKTKWACVGPMCAH